MMENGYTTSDLPKAVLADEVLVNRVGNTSRVGIAQFAQLMLSQPAFSGSAFANIAYFRGSLAELTTASPAAGAHGAVLSNDDDAGIYRFDGSMWVWQAPIPAILTESLSAVEAKEARDQVVAMLETVGTLSELETIAGTVGDDRASAAEYAEEARTAAQDALNSAPFVVKDAAAFFALTDLVVGARYLAKDGSGSWDVLTHAETGVLNHPGTGHPLLVAPVLGYHVASAYGVMAGGPSVDSHAALQLAINASTAAGFPLLITPGNYHISTGLTVPNGGYVVGTNRNSCVIIGMSDTFTGVTLGGQQAKVKGIYVRGCRVGVANTENVTSFCQVENCRLSYNKVGMLLRDSYIFDIHKNYIAFNRIGVISGNQSFQVNLRANVIDNNLGGVGVLSYGAAGLSLTDNTIEGNRRELTAGDPDAFGVGVWISGYAQRVNMQSNWMEQNGNRDECSDVILGRPDVDWITALADALEPELSEFVGGATYTSLFKTAFPASGVIHLGSNFHYATKRAVTANLSFADVAAITVEGAEFVGVKSRGNRPIEIYGASTGTFAARSNRVVNTGDISITPDMMQGIKASYIYHSGTVPTYGLVTLDGVDLFTAEMTQAQFLTLPGATLNAQVRTPSSGNSTIKYGAVRVAGGGLGTRVVAGTGRPRAGAAALFTPGVAHVYASIGRGDGAGLTVYGPGGYSFVSANDSDGRTVIRSVTPVGAEATVHTGDYYGWLVMPASVFQTSAIRGCTRLVITDLMVSEDVVSSPTIPPSLPSASLYVWQLGDYVRNSNPVPDGYGGWVCVAAGSPGTWKGVGRIEA